MTSFRSCLGRPMLQSALDHYRAEQRITAAGLIALRRSRFDTLDALMRAALGYQLLAAREASAAVPLMLAEQAIDVSAEATTRPSALAGWASDGRAIRGLLDYTRDPSVTGPMFDRIVSTQLQDVARQAAAIEMAVRPQVTSYVRVLNPPSCSRCAVLAGRIYRKSSGFRRHPRCDCRHVPTTRSEAGGLTTDPRAYFDSLDQPEQDRIFTKAGAEAIRLGANMGKVVNARRGMATAQSGRIAAQGAFGQRLFTTVEAAPRGAVRLMPESILAVAEGDAEAIRLLRAHGYIA